MNQRGPAHGYPALPRIAHAAQVSDLSIEAVMLAFFRHSFALHIRAQRGAASGERSDDDGGSDDGGSDDGDDGMEIDAPCDARQVEDGVRTSCAKLHDVGLLPYAARIHWPLLSAPRVAAGAVAAISDADARIRADISAFGVCASQVCARVPLADDAHGNP